MEVVRGAVEVRGRRVDGEGRRREVVVVRRVGNILVVVAVVVVLVKIESVLRLRLRSCDVEIMTMYGRE